ncbi:MAG: hypothetical protein J5J00_04805 [Deltaproteobacteria bacterium]|nr:hypothetical protein [Deltaproteobacteria bacterium]
MAEQEVQAKKEPGKQAAPQPAADPTIDQTTTVDLGAQARQMHQQEQEQYVRDPKQTAVINKTFDVARTAVDVQDWDSALEALEFAEHAIRTNPPNLRAPIIRVDRGAAGNQTPEQAQQGRLNAFNSSMNTVDAALSRGRFDHALQSIEISQHALSGHIDGRNYKYTPAQLAKMTPEQQQQAVTAELVDTINAAVERGELSVADRAYQTYMRFTANGGAPGSQVEMKDAMRIEQQLAEARGQEAALKQEIDAVREAQAEVAELSGQAEELLHAFEGHVEQQKQRVTELEADREKKEDSYHQSEAERRIKDREIDALSEQIDKLTPEAAKARSDREEAIKERDSKVEANNKLNEDLKTKTAQLQEEQAKLDEAKVVEEEKAAALKPAADHKQQLEEKIKGIETQAAEITAALGTAEVELAQAKQALEAATEKGDPEAVKVATAHHQREVAEREQAQKDLMEKALELSEQLKQDRIALEKATTEFNTLNAALDQAKAGTAPLQTAVDATTKEIEGIHGKIAEATSAIEEMNKRISSYDETIKQEAELKQQHEQKKVEFEQLEAAVNKAHAEYTTADQASRAATVELTAMADDLEEAKAEADKREEERLALEAKEKELAAAMDAAQKAVAQLEASLAAKQAAIKEGLRRSFNDRKKGASDDAEPAAESAEPQAKPEEKKAEAPSEPAPGAAKKDEPAAEADATAPKAPGPEKAEEEAAEA